MKTIIATIGFLMFTTVASAWPTCHGVWQQLPGGTTATGSTYRTGDGLTFQCVTTPTATPTTINNTVDPYVGQDQKQKQQQNQTQGQAQTANSTSIATAGANASNNGSNNTFIDSPPKIPVETAFAPAMWPTVSCFKPMGAGAQTMAVGGSLGFGKIDDNCAILEAASKARSLTAYCKVYITQKYVKKAGVTMADCMAVPPPPAPIVPIMPQIQPEPLPQPPIIITPQITVPITVIPVETPIVKKPVVKAKKPVKLACPEVPKSLLEAK